MSNHRNYANNNFFLKIIKSLTFSKKLKAEKTDIQFFTDKTSYYSKKGVEFIIDVIKNKKTSKLAYGLNSGQYGVFVLDFNNGALISARRYYNNKLYDEYSFESYSLDINHLDISQPFKFEPFITNILISADRIYRKLYLLDSNTISYQLIEYGKKIVDNKLDYDTLKVDTFYKHLDNYRLCSLNLLDKTFKSYNHKGIIRADVSVDCDLLLNIPPDLSKKYALLYDCFGNEFLSISFNFQNAEPDYRNLTFNGIIKLHDGTVFNIDKNNTYIEFRVTVTDKHLEYLNEISENNFKDISSQQGDYTIHFNKTGCMESNYIKLDNGIFLDPYYASMLFVLPRSLHITTAKRTFTQTFDSEKPAVTKRVDNDNSALQMLLKLSNPFR